MERVDALVETFPGLLRSAAEALLTRHGYNAGKGEAGPQWNVLGHPLMQLPIWIDSASASPLDDQVLADIHESSLCGYLAVRAEDDYFDGPGGDPETAMMLANAFRSRHLSMIARHTSDHRLWSRVDVLWQQYSDAMLFEKKSNEPASDYRSEDFDRILLRSQPLEIPADVVLLLKGRWEEIGLVGRLVAHLAKATQIFDDFVDAPEDLAMGNHTFMVRRLNGEQGEQALRRNMLEMCDQVMEMASAELDLAAVVAAELRVIGLAEWVDARKEKMAGVSERGFRALFDTLTNPTTPGALGTA